MKIIQASNYEEMSKAAYKSLHQFMQMNQHPVLGLATGSTPEGLYRLMIDACKKGEVSFASTETFNLDEYAGLSKDDKNSYRYYMNHKLFDHIDIRPERAHILDGEAADLELECREYDQKIMEVGGIGLQLLGIGLNGHIGFNEPGTSFDAATHISELAETTRKANSRFFNSLDEVPTKAMSMGISKIMESREILLLVSGEGKAEALHTLLTGEITENFPASILKNHPNVTIIADQAAIGGKKFPDQVG